MNEQELLELAPLAALGALEGAERAAFEARLPRSPRLQAELVAFERIVGMLPLALDPTAPAPRSRLRILESPAGPSLSRPKPRRSLPGWLAAAAAVALALGMLLLRGQRDEARLAAAALSERSASLIERSARLERELERARLDAAEGRSVRKLIGTPALRLVNLAGQKPAPGARARALYDPATREAVLMVAGLARAPEGSVYEVWVIAAGAPAPAGTFQVDAEGTALLRLAPLEETARAKTFAVSLEPAPGGAAPTGPIVLAGQAS